MKRERKSVAFGEFPSILNLTAFRGRYLRNIFLKNSDVSENILFPDWVSGSLILMKKDLFIKKQESSTRVSGCILKM